MRRSRCAHELAVDADDKAVARSRSSSIKPVAGWCRGRDIRRRKGRLILAGGASAHVEADHAIGMRTHPHCIAASVDTKDLDVAHVARKPHTG